LRRARLKVRSPSSDEVLRAPVAHGTPVLLQAGRVSIRHEVLQAGVHVPACFRLATRALLTPRRRRASSARLSDVWLNHRSDVPARARDGNQRRRATRCPRPAGHRQQAAMCPRARHVVHRRRAAVCPREPARLRRPGEAACFAARHRSPKTCLLRPSSTSGGAHVGLCLLCDPQRRRRSSSGAPVRSKTCQRPCSWRRSPSRGSWSTPELHLGPPTGRRTIAQPQSPAAVASHESIAGGGVTGRSQRRAALLESVAS